MTSSQLLLFNLFDATDLFLHPLSFYFQWHEIGSVFRVEEMKGVSYSPSPELVRIFGNCVIRMTPSTDCFDCLASLYFTVIISSCEGIVAKFHFEN